MRIIKLLIALCISSCAFAQENINCNKIEKNQGISVVEFWAEWNETNCVKFIEELKDCNKYRVDVQTHTDCMKNYKVSSLPTLIVFDGDEEVFRWEADISFKLDLEEEEVQKKVDEIILDKI